MKKILTTLACGAIFASTVSADFIRVEMGAGAWAQTPKGYIEANDGSGALSLNGTYNSSEKSTTNTYAWALIKHPVPIIPNLRLEYVTLTDEGVATGRVNGFLIPGSAPTSFDITQYDIVPYYNILDNTFWTTIDLGIDIKMIQTDVKVVAVKSNIPLIPDFNAYSNSVTTALPFLYLRGRVQIPVTNIGFEADVKAISYGGNAMYDARAKVDYTLDFIPIVQPGLEVGYRVQQLKVDDGTKSQVDLQYSGVYAGLILRF